VIIIGEKINSTLKSVQPAIENYEAGKIKELAIKQKEAGASYIDINAGMFYADEPERLEWLAKTVEEAVDIPVVIDSTNPIAIEKALKVSKNTKPIINSITNETERYNSIVPLIQKYDTQIVALCMDDTGMPETTDERVKIGEQLIEKLTKAGVKQEHIHIDPMIRPIGTGSHYGVVALETIMKVKQEFPDVHITCGLSNISFGIPARKLMNQVFLVTAIYAGMDGAILDPLDKKLMSVLLAAEAVMGKDDFCMNYITKFREGNLEY